jgi:hypothetical protein
MQVAETPDPNAGAENRPERPAPGESMIFAGHARLPKAIAGAETCVGLEIEISGNVVVELASRAVLPRAEGLLREVLIGRSFDEPLAPSISELQRRYHGADSRAICTAVLNAHANYLRWRQSGD